MTFTVVAIFLGVSLLFYVLFAGADFGAGIVELFTGSKEEKTVGHAIGPIWEANHIWLILVVVILFMGFPSVYTVLTTYLHIPLILLLLGIVLRGSAFTFRHYDAYYDSSNRVYSWVFKLSSLITPVFLGMVVGAMISGRMALLKGSFYDLYIYPWWDWFPLAVGVFTTCLFGFLAAVYLIGDARDEKEKRNFETVARKLNTMTVIAGGLVFLAAELGGIPLLNWLFDSTESIVAVVLATISLPFMWYALAERRVVLSRILAGFQVLMIIGAWFFMQYPKVILLSNAEDMTLLNTAAPEATLRQLMLALIVGSALILPSLYFLLKTFKKSQGKV